MTFWIVCAAIVLFSVAALLSVLRRRVVQAADRSEYDVNVYKDQLKELEREAAEGRIADAELAAAKLEIERRLLTAAEAAAKPQSTGGSWPLVAVAVAAPVVAVAFYLTIGTPGMPDFPLAERTDRINTAEDADRAMMSLVRTLEGRLQQQPNDARGWVLLGRSYATMGNQDKAIAAFAKALPLTNRDPAILADWAEMNLMKREGAFTEDIFKAFSEARQRNPALPKPWFYIGLDRAQGGKYREAAQLWTDLIAISPPDVSYGPAVREKIAEAARDGGFDVAELKPSDRALEIAAQIGDAAGPAAPPSAASPQMPGPTREDVEAAGQMSTEDRNAFIRSMVERLASRLDESPNDPAGWQRLINAYEVLGETEKAEAARAKLKALQGQ